MCHTCSTEFCVNGLHYTLTCCVGEWFVFGCACMLVPPCALSSRQKVAACDSRSVQPTVCPFHATWVLNVVLVHITVSRHVEISIASVSRTTAKNDPCLVHRNSSHSPHAGTCGLLQYYFEVVFQMKLLVRTTSYVHRHNTTLNTDLKISVGDNASLSKACFISDESTCKKTEK